MWYGDDDIGNDDYGGDGDDNIAYNRMGEVRIGLAPCVGEAM